MKALRLSYLHNNRAVISLWLPTLITVCKVPTQVIKLSSSEFMDARLRSAALVDLVESTADMAELELN